MSKEEILNELEEFHAALEEKYGEEFVDYGWGREAGLTFEIEMENDCEPVEDQFVVYRNDGTRMYLEVDPADYENFEDSRITVSGAALGTESATRDKEILGLLELVEQDGSKIQSYNLPVDQVNGGENEFDKDLRDLGLKPQTFESTQGCFYSVGEEDAERLLERVGVTSFEYTGSAEDIVELLLNIDVDGYKPEHEEA